MTTQLYNLNLDSVQGNAFYLLALAKQIIKDNQLDLDFKQVEAEMISNDYDNLIDVFYSYFYEYLI